MNIEQEKFVQRNSPDGGFLQSEDWIGFQENTGKNVFGIVSDCFCAKVVLHKLPIVGGYGYVPRGPVFDLKKEGCIEDVSEKFLELIGESKKNGLGWLRIDALSREQLKFIESLDVNIKKAPHNTQPKQIFVIDISDDEEGIMSSMKPKTRYNIRLAKKKGVEVESFDKNHEKFEEHLEEFLRLTKVMAKRSKITPHPDAYYRKMVESISSEQVKLYVAKYEGKIITSALVIFYGEMATYLHGASDDEYRNVMAPFLLQWIAILDARERGCMKYDFGGIDVSKVEGKTNISKSSLEGVTRFKLGFSKNTDPVEYLGSYDLILSPLKYKAYLLLQKLKKILKFAKK
ncbi:lipid II:glycine glycyltransferase FemX [Patescibacteria group bacterium]